MMGQVRFGLGLGLISGFAGYPIIFRIFKLSNRISVNIIFENMLGQFRFGLGLRSRSDFTGYYIDDDMYAVTLQCPGLVYNHFWGIYE